VSGAFDPGLKATIGRDVNRSREYPVSVPTTSVTWASSPTATSISSHSPGTPMRKSAPLKTVGARHRQKPRSTETHPFVGDRFTLKKGRLGILLRRAAA